MKKVFLCILGAVIIALAAVNLNFNLKSDSNAIFNMASMVSLAKGEGGDGSGGCDSTYSVHESLLVVRYEWQCVSGDSSGCYVGNDYYHKSSDGSIFLYCCTDGGWIPCPL